MQADLKALEDLNVEIGEAEDKGDGKRLGEILAPKLAFQRADDKKTLDDRMDFLQKVAPKKDTDTPRTTRISEPILVRGDRAIVECVVTRNGTDYHNIRLFVKRDGKWMLLGWANEEWKSPK